MKFACDKCGAKYSIADEKVHGKILRIRCKKCSHIVEVRHPGIGAAASASEAPRPATRAAAAAATSPLAAEILADKTLDAEFERAFGRVVTSPGGVRPAASGAALDLPARDSDKTVLYDYSRELLAGDAAAKAAPTAAAPAPDAIEWYLAIDGEQLGPMTVAEVERRLHANPAPERIYAWRDGMPDWARVGDLPELSRLIAGPPALREHGSLIEATAVPSGGGVSMVSSRAPAEPSRLDLDLDLGTAAGSPGAEPVQIAPDRKLPEEISLPPPSVIPSMTQPPARKLPVATVVLLVLLLGAGVVLLLAALDIIYIPYISSDPATSRAEMHAQPPAPPGAEQILKRDPLLDRQAPRVVVEPVDRPRAAPPTPKRSGRRDPGRERPATTAAGPDPPARPAGSDAPAAATPELSELDKRVYGSGTGGSASRPPPHLLAKSDVPVAAARGLSQEVISDVIRKYRSGIENCYQKQVRSDSTVRGRLTLSLKIGANGRVQRAGVEDAMKETVMGKCVVRIAKTWRFPPSGGDVEVDYPLILEPTQ